jgi:hypothetical protein
MRHGGARSDALAARCGPSRAAKPVGARGGLPGGHCTLCVTYLGEMLAFGRNDFGQLGLGEYTSTPLQLGLGE